MQIKIEIDVKPEELRRFLGLPDVAGLQEDVIQFLREKVGAASEGFDPASFVKDNLQSLRESSAWRKIVSAAKAGGATVAKASPSAGASRGTRPRAKAGRSAAPRKTAARRQKFEAAKPVEPT